MVAGCTAHRQAVVDPRPTEEPPELPTRVYRSANFSCAVAGTTVSGQVRMAEDSIIWASVSKVIELGRATATPDSVIVYAKAMGRCFRGTYDDIYTRFHYRTSFADLQEMLLAPDADEQLRLLALRFGVDASVHFQPWRELKEPSFPMYVPPQARSL